MPLNCFSKVYENVIKNELLKSMNIHLAPFISADRKNCNTQHVATATCLVNATGRMERTFRQQQNSGRNINGSFKGF